MTGRPITLTAAAAIEAAQGLIALGFGLYVGWEAIVGKPLDPASAIGVTLFAFLAAGGMLAVARGLLRADRWSRSPAVLTQLFALPVSVSMLQGDQYALGVPLIVLAVAALVLVLCKPSNDALVHEEEPHGE
ncbi:hypothetical protein [Actinomadura sp. HBU206391]|uniref:hypothetical protein n=1 Tax=Actinomadura sp. HBU206391 TaxID=2731692 RepID=UPI00164FA385|nr:hypothetical protein [Actinomadura sp. HBU206391]MBC6459287.1 hypothetical protein [Actinomadura sp. HBU206391]